MSEMMGRIVDILRGIPVRDLQFADGELDRLRLFEAARAVLFCLREPTEAMKVAADASMTGVYYWRYEVKDESASGRSIYQAMIDEALK